MDETKGWLGWMSKEGVRRQANPASVYLSSLTVFNMPVYVLPLDPDGPLPGQEWESPEGDRVTVIGPSTLHDSGAVPRWWVRDSSGITYTFPAHHLSRIPRTRTVTVELDEEEVAHLKSHWTTPAYRSGITGIASKLLAALEDS